jgi:hypothetical protein
VCFVPASHPRGKHHDHLFFEAHDRAEASLWLLYGLRYAFHVEGIPESWPSSEIDRMFEKSDGRMCGVLY